MALQRAKRLAVQDRLEWPPPGDPVCKILLGVELRLSEFIELDDVSVLQCFKAWTKSDDATLASLCQGLLYRRLFKTIDLSAYDDEQIAGIVRRAESLVDDAGGDSAYTLFYDAPADTPYKGGSETTVAKEILILGTDGRCRPLAEVSPFADGLIRQLSFKRLHVTENWRDRVAGVLPEVLLPSP